MARATSPLCTLATTLTSTSAFTWLPAVRMVNWRMVRRPRGA